MNKKPTRHECGVGILGFWGMNLKSIQINHRHPATRINQTSMPIKKSLIDRLIMFAHHSPFLI